MAPIACETSKPDRTAPQDSAALIARATHVEIGVFSRQHVALPPTCDHVCVNVSENDVEPGVCDVVRELIEGVTPRKSQDPCLCDRGHWIAVDEGAESDSAVLLLHRCDNDDDASVAERCAARLQAVRDLVRHVEAQTQESRGLALELIDCYEQLNVIFDITRRVGGTQDVGQVRSSLIRVLAETLACDWVCCFSREGETLWWCADGLNDRASTLAWIERTFADAIEKVSQNRQVFVCNASQDPLNVAPFSIMVGLLRGEEPTHSFVAVGRRAGRPDFKSPHMRMLDTVLNHGGQVISNLQLLARLRTLSTEAVLALVSAIDKKDAYTSGHSERVGLLSRLVGEEMGLSASDLQDLEWAGILHDVGKIGISEGILTKPGSLTTDEFDLIKLHPQMSLEVIEPLRSFGAVRDAVLHHHETPDGEGYPDGLKGEQIPLLARIVHITDTFDALTSDRSYRPGFPLQKAIEIMREEKGRKIDPTVEEAFERAFGRFRAEQPDRYREVFSHIRESAP